MGEERVRNTEHKTEQYLTIVLYVKSYVQMGIGVREMEAYFATQ